MYAPPEPKREPSKSLLLAEKISRVAGLNQDRVNGKNLIEACRCVTYWAKRFEIPAHIEIMLSLFYVENRFQEDPSNSARYYTQINTKWQWIFEREIWRLGTTLGFDYGICEQSALGVAAYKMKLIEAGGDPVEAVRIYNHRTHPFSYTHQRRVLMFYNQLERENEKAYYLPDTSSNLHIGKRLPGA